VLEHRDSRDYDGARQTWYSFGIRPLWFVTDHLRLASELGLDRVDSQTGDGILGKRIYSL
jgi:maltoporin